MDKFRVDVLGQMESPQTLMYAALHQDYSEKYIFDELPTLPNESKCGELAIKYLLDGKKGHFGPIEHPQMVFSIGHFPHNVMQQARTHRVGVSFDVQSFRYTGNRICEVAENFSLVEDVFYIRPVGSYADRKGVKYVVTQEQREEDILYAFEAAKKYRDSIKYRGYSEEHARSLIPFDTRQHFVFSGNCRSIMHFLDMRAKKDAQIEIQKVTELMFSHFQLWVPEIADWYYKNRWQKALLAP
jgi:thymidylate synthase (FAD)